MDQLRPAGTGAPMPAALPSYALLFAAAAGATLFLTYTAFDPGPLSHHMARHVLIMNVAAPVAATALYARRPGSLVAPLGLAAASTLQLLLLWGWHTPPALAASEQSPLLMLLMHLSLFGAALLFWLAIHTAASREHWRSLLALLVTAKLFCLLGAVLTFSPRALYDFSGHAHGVHAGGALADQQLAGLLMLAACPLTYVVAGVVLAVEWVRDLDRDDGWTGPSDVQTTAMK